MKRWGVAASFSHRDFRTLGAPLLRTRQEDPDRFDVGWFSRTNSRKRHQVVVGLVFLPIEPRMSHADDTSSL